ncbi:Cytochrome c oxidase, subunit IIc [Oceaniovalibus guishaninsula JLT2003]|uniref:Cytochrome aa3 subunit 2 n=2 Tax=Oceaniovalibus TaxID=1207070 RepID=K2I7L3_9RHOB|nr:Cytochrome c oxidase, subunit IIc [Oceaniovalibus guishaninsula JLT2003]
MAVMPVACMPQTNRQTAAACRRAAGCLAMLALLGACEGRQAVLNPAGQDAAVIARLFLGMLTGAVILWLLVAGLFLYVTVFRVSHMPRRWAESLIVGGGVLFPTFVLAGLLSYSLPLMSSQRTGGDGLVVHVRGEQWWWRVTYETPQGNRAVSANEVRLPAGRRTEFRLTADKVIHSFWIPALGGKTDMIPGRETVMTLEPAETGLFRGQCAEFCGASHALMAFEVETMAPDLFDEWLRHAASDAVPPATEAARRGAGIFAAEGCGACHTVRGTPALGRVGPDLTHVGSRHSIGAALLPVTAADLALWVGRTGHLKPDVEMPQYDHLLPDALLDLGRYLEGLK